ncbi:MAG: DUF4982 domain-containing protein [Labilibaculum sp.]|nr:DUF4982 domain-containing protein [Labilibaculum sp.]
MRNKKELGKLLTIIFIFLFFVHVLKAQNGSDFRTRSFDQGWSFKLNTYSIGPESPDFDDSSWRKVNLPHDWSIEDLPSQISEDTGPYYKNSNSGILDGFLFGGTGWYRKKFQLSKNEEGKKVIIQFDGVYMNSEVWVNGNYLGIHPYGYSPFYYDITSFLNSSGQNNVIAVRVRNEGRTRWYSGSGIYRHVHLTVVNPLHIDVWGIHVTTPVVSESSANVNVVTTVKNSGTKKESFILVTKIINKKGKVIEKTERKAVVGLYGSVETEQISIKNPALWSAENPNLYTVQVEILQGEKQVDQVTIPFGIRNIQISAENGLMVNGNSVLLKGGCIHHDNGPLGAVSLEAAEERKIKLLKENGFNAVRMSHNPPSKILLDVCDRLGMYVIDESFDCWNKAKGGDYHKYFEEYWDKDLTAMILRDRNHPSIILWSIGNEIPGSASEEGLKIRKMLRDRVKELDTTRMVNEGVCENLWSKRGDHWEELSPAVFNLLDVGGYNYLQEKYESDHEKYPNRIILGTESHPAKTYEIWQLVKKHPYIIGDFVWTALDYRGESSLGLATLIKDKGKRRKVFGPWPWNNAFCGDLDYIGHKKPQSYYRDVVWDLSNIEMFVQKLSVPEGMRYHISKWGWPDELKSWSWQGSEGDTLQVRVYTKNKLVKLELNGKLIGEQVVPDTAITATFQVPYQPGTLVAKAYDNGNEVSSTTLKTVGAPATIRLIPDRTNIKANNNDLSYVTVEIVDDEGNLIPYADDIEVNYTIIGPGEIAGVGNGNPKDVSSMQQPKKKVFQGKGLVIIRPNGTPGKITLKAQAKGLKENSIEIITQ